MAKAFPCRECDKVFTAKSTLSGHLASVHRGERSVCEVCQKGFTDKSNLRRHKRTCTGNAGLHRCAWHEFGCNHSSNRVDNVKRHIKSCTHKPTGWADELPGPIRADEEGAVHNDQVLDNRTPPVNGLPFEAQEDAQAEQLAPPQEQNLSGYGVFPPLEHWQQPTAQEEPALAQEPVVTLQMGVAASQQQGTNLAEGNPTDPAWFSANYPQFRGYWWRDEPQKEPAAVPQSPAALGAVNYFQEGFAPEENAAYTYTSPFTAYGQGAGAFLPNPPVPDSEFIEFLATRDS